MAELVFRNVLIRPLLHGVLKNKEAVFSSAQEKVLAGLARELPSFLGLLVFTGTAYLAYFASVWSDLPFLRLIFLALLVGIVLLRFSAMILRLLFSPSSPSFRLLPLACPAARAGYYLSTFAAAYLIITFVFIAIVRKLGGPPVTVNLLQLFFASLLLVFTAVVMFVFRGRINAYILQGSQNLEELSGWGRRHFSRLWYLSALAYLVCLWFLLLVDLADAETRHRGAFLLSFFILPIWLIADRLVQWVVNYSMVVLKIREAETANDDVADSSLSRVMIIARFLLAISLLLWLASLWYIRIPFLSIFSKVLFDGLVTIALALLFWAFVSRLIENKIRESMPEETEENEDDEWGGAAARGRAYTLLPMLRKFIGTILVTMVTLTILSAMGVNIGPLLAGAGVVGLAVGFGAQKLVADMFSGFFYLLDDAFRVGEYIEAGPISGTVEAISLRNVMLRHHRGMLEIVPHSDLGAITNYMRGGIVVKFNLDFPYDADIEQIRKVVKKVGQAMLQDEELGKDFIKPVKSQGVREITNSVMTIRIKFTARPGAHFVIRREAFRRITEALRAKGIDYAHRKVIVDLPQNQNGIDPSQEAIRNAAGAAAQAVADTPGEKEHSGNSSREF